MKRNALVSYSSSSEDEDDGVQAIVRPVLKKRKLPSLSPALVVAAPTDNPLLHQGRIRTTPHVDGQYAAHVYMCIKLSRTSPLYKLLSEVLKSSKDIAPTLQDSWSTDVLTKPELHISLSRPTFLRAHQREEMKRAVKAVAQERSPFNVSFAAFAELTNDERTRTFLTMEVGAGYHELRALSDALTPILQTFRQKEYYPDPRFHASIAWALLERAIPTSPTEMPPRILDTDAAPRSPDLHLDSLSGDTLPAAHASHIPNSTTKFPTIPHLPQDLLPSLNAKYQATLSSKAGSFHIAEISLRIGKDVFTWCLKGI